jgi:hypothetical protein
MFEKAVEVTPKQKEQAIKMNLFKMTISMVCFWIITFAFKLVYQNYRYSLWEDIYGRAVVFFICSVIDYMRQPFDVSLFDIRP